MEKKSFLEKHIKIIVVFAVVAGSSSGIFGKAIDASSMAIGFWRLTIGLHFFALPTIIKKRNQFKIISAKTYSCAFIAGIFLFFHFYLWFNAVKMTNIASAVVLNALHPLVVLVATVLIFRKHVGIKSVFGILVALAGGIVVAGLDYSKLSSGNFNGDVMALAASVCMGVYFIIGSETRKKIDGPVYVTLVFFSCWICFCTGMIISKTPVLGYSARDYILLVLLTIVCQIGAHAVFNICLGYVDSLYVSAWESGESIFAIILGMIFLDQIPTIWEWAGAIIVISGLLYYNVSISGKFTKTTEI